ncbi:unnamed protein product [Protopolystoma xenopodis]|uniref:Uncharacterized protein n=1 Tax=Protopolystoma xenopodis TaxID=117903 RepID=A0A3S5FFF2_9PLAT|nr:unnamed protein product [Protopolystoma xenopodis]
MQNTYVKPKSVDESQCFLPEEPPENDFIASETKEDNLHGSGLGLSSAGQSGSLIHLSSSKSIELKAIARKANQVVI